MSATADKPVLPGSLNTNRMLERWVRFEADGTVGIRVGKVESSLNEAMPICSLRGSASPNEVWPRP